MLVAWSAVLAFGWWFTDRKPFSTGALLTLLITAGVVIAVGAARRQRPRSTAPDRSASHFYSAVMVWSALSVAVVAWELLALRSLPRSTHPTISSFVENIEQYHVARLGLYALWIALGWMLAS